MAKFELSIYGENDEVIKKYTTNHIRWGVLLKAVEINDKLKDMDESVQFKAISEIVMSIFEGLTSDELEKADYNDVVNTFKQLLLSAQKINGGNSKNV